MREHETSRIEGFSDAAFGFALTLLVVSLEVPQTFADLKRTLVGFLPFAVTFALVCWIWYLHYAFFRRFGLRDGLTVFLNCLLLFVVLFFVYPLKFVFGNIIPVAGDHAAHRAPVGVRDDLRPGGTHPGRERLPYREGTRAKSAFIDANAPVSSSRLRPKHRRM
jgi:hypothetical protein